MRLARLGDAVVLDRHAAAVLDLVGDVAFLQEALGDALVARELVVEDLERLARAVPVRGGVHRRHAADAQQGVEAELVVDGEADPGAGSRFLVSAAQDLGFCSFSHGSGSVGSGNGSTPRVPLGHLSEGGR